MARKKQRKATVVAGNAAADGVTKSQLVRNALAKHTDLGPLELAAKLAEEGLMVSAQFISTVKSNLKAQNRRGRKAGTRAGVSNNRNTQKVSIDGLKRAKQFVAAVGNADRAKTLLSAYTELTN